MALLLKSGSYGAMDTKIPTKMFYYVINFVSEAYTIQEDTTIDGKIVQLVNWIQITVYELYAGK